MWLTGMALANLPFQHEDLEERMALFQECDPHGNGHVSFAEIDAVFRIKFSIGDAEKRMMLQAFDAAERLGSDAAEPARDYIEHNEFRAFLEHLATIAMLESQVARLNEAAASGSAAAIAAATIQGAAEQEEHRQKVRRIIAAEQEEHRQKARRS